MFKIDHSLLTMFILCRTSSRTRKPVIYKFFSCKVITFGFLLHKCSHDQFCKWLYPVCSSSFFSSSISLCAREIFALSFGVFSPTCSFYEFSTSWAKSLIFSLNDNLAPSGPFGMLCFFSCCSANRLVRGSLYTS